MNSKLKEGELRKELRRLFRSMDFVSQHPALKKEDTEADRYAEIYQQLGLAWEYLAAQCKHQIGWRKLRDGKVACKTCGLIKTSGAGRGLGKQRRKRA